MLKRYNNRLKEIGEVCEITKPLSGSVARHSYTNCLKQKGVATDIISESLGHQNLAVTQAYLKELDNTLVDEAVMGGIKTVSSQCSVFQANAMRNSMLKSLILV